MESKAKFKTHANTMHQEYLGRFQTEFDFMASGLTFVEVALEKKKARLRDPNDQPNSALQYLLEVALESLLLSLCRIWETQARGTRNALSIPVLYSEFSDEKFLGFGDLQPGSKLRVEICEILEMPMLREMIYLRTEGLAHFLIAGTGGDRKKNSKLGWADTAWEDAKGYEIDNEGFLSFIRQTLSILATLLDSQTLIKPWKKGIPMEDRLTAFRSSYEHFSI
jgi:hypothetical protein